jgi:hydrogenase expression/formation protein HypC
MCLGLPGQVVEFQPGSDLAQVDIAGVLRDINVAMLAEELQPGDYILVHSGFGLERMSAPEARDALASFGPNPPLSKQ